MHDRIEKLEGLVQSLGGQGSSPYLDAPSQHSQLPNRASLHRGAEGVPNLEIPVSPSRGNRTQEQERIRDLEARLERLQQESRIPNVDSGGPQISQAHNNALPSKRDDDLEYSVRSIMEQMFEEAKTAKPTAQTNGEREGPPNEDIAKESIKFKDCVGRKFNFPFHKCMKWDGIARLIKQAFLHVDIIGEHVNQGHYDLTGPDGGIILPQVWESIVQPGWEITMHLWPMPEDIRNLDTSDVYTRPNAAQPSSAGRTSNARKKSHTVNTFGTAETPVSGKKTPNIRKPSKAADTSNNVETPDITDKKKTRPRKKRNPKSVPEQSPPLSPGGFSNLKSPPPDHDLGLGSRTPRVDAFRREQER